MSSSRISALLHLSAVRQALWLLALFSSITLVAWGGTYWFMQREILRDVDTRLLARMEAAVAAMGAGQALPQPGDGGDCPPCLGSRRLPVIFLSVCIA